MNRRLLAVVSVVFALLAALLYSQSRKPSLRVSGFVEADDVRLGSRVGGRVAQVLVDEGAKVAKGDPLVVLEPYQLNELLAQASAERSQREAALRRAKAGFRQEEIAQAEARFRQWEATVEKLTRGPRDEDIAVARSQLELAQAELRLAELRDARTANLLAERAGSQEDRDQAMTELRVVQATAQTRREELTKLERGTRPEEIAEAEAQREAAKQAWLLLKNGYREEDIAEAQAAVEAAAAAQASIEEQLKELTVVAPVDGVIEAIELRPGDLVGAGAPIVSILDPKRLWVRTYIPENRLRHELGSRVRVTLDSFPDETFQGELTFIARQAEFTPGNVQTPEERSKQVFRVKVTLVDAPDRVRPGMAADIWLQP